MRIAKAAVGIVTHNRREAVLRLLSHLYPQLSRFEGIVVYIVENGSNDLSQSDVDLSIAQLIHLKRASIPQARNMIIEATRNRYEKLAFIDDDCIPSTDWVEQLIKATFTKSEIGLQGSVESIPKLNLYAQTTQLLYESWIAKNRYSNSKKIKVLDTKNVVFNLRELHKNSVIFDEKYTYASDAAIASACVLQGFSIRYFPVLKVQHIERTTAKEFIKHRVRQSYAFRLLAMKSNELKRESIRLKVQKIWSELQQPWYKRIYVLVLLMTAACVVEAKILCKKFRFYNF